jgi:hypothetical protein
MKMRVLVGLLIAAVLIAGAANAQSAQLEFKAERVPVGTVFHYIKSTLDGAHEGHISVYVPTRDRLESLKWEPHADRATLVVAEMDWSRFSVKRFEAYQLMRDRAPEQRATLVASTDGSQLQTSFKAEPVSIHHWPWHSYDFDFTSLNFTLPHWTAPETQLQFWRTDYVYGESPDVRELGPVTLKFEATERHAGKSTRRYSIGGPGLEHNQGQWWADARTGLLVEYRIPIGDEPGYDNVRLRLDSTQKMSAEEWEQFKLIVNSEQ